MSTDSGGDLTFNIYGYVPSLAAALVFVVVFSLITIVQTGLVLRSKIWWLSILVIGGIGEIIGWAGRLWSNRNVYSLDAFLCQQCALILAPCFFSAGCYGLLGMLVRALGPEHSPLRPALYLVIFCTMDLVAIVIQAVGGAMAAIALENDDESKTGTWIMVAGILFQLVAMVAFCTLGLIFARNVRVSSSWKASGKRSQGRVHWMAWGLAWISAWILVRCIYRAIELAQGWTGYLIQHEPYFDVLDATSMVFAQAGFCFCWPSFCLPNARTLHRTQDVKIQDGVSPVATEKQFAPV
ncbi:RTA1 domain-containing protein [Sporobolomyces koalae]|uniref:RTA1 domain-containing protein n=1 Tax=Sporobolomyces koalae TaxID=500713 RepID=UPI00316C6C78